MAKTLDDVIAELKKFNERQDKRDAEEKSRKQKETDEQEAAKPGSGRQLAGAVGSGLQLDMLDDLGKLNEVFKGDISKLPELIKSISEDVLNVINKFKNVFQNISQGGQKDAQEKLKDVRNEASIRGGLLAKGSSELSKEEAGAGVAEGGAEAGAGALEGVGGGAVEAAGGLVASIGAAAAAFTAVLAIVAVIVAAVAAVAAFAVACVAVVFKIRDMGAAFLESQREVAEYNTGLAQLLQKWDVFMQRYQMALGSAITGGQGGQSSSLNKLENSLEGLYTYLLPHIAIMTNIAAEILNVFVTMAVGAIVIFERWTVKILEALDNVINLVAALADSKFKSEMGKAFRQAIIDARNIDNVTPLQQWILESAKPRAVGP